MWTVRKILITAGLHDSERVRQTALALSRLQNGKNGETAARSKTKTARIDFRCSENEKNCIELLAAKYAGGSISKLILDTLQWRYPTL